MFDRLGAWLGLHRWENSTDTALPAFAAEAARPKNELASECYLIIRRVIGAIQKKDFLDADALWKQLCELCEANGITPQSLLGPDVTRITLLEEILLSRNSRLASFFRSRIPYGMYSQNRVMNSREGLFTMCDGERRGPAFCFVASGALYTGGLRGDRFDGAGSISYAYGDIYEGNWSDGKKVSSTTWRAEKGTLAACLYGSKKRLGGGPNSINECSGGLFNANT